MLPETVAQEYATAIRTARLEEPEAFVFVDKLERELPDLDRSRRGRLPPITRLFESMDEVGLWPLVEVVAFDGPSGEGWSATARRAWQAGLVEALGKRRDVRLIPLFDALLADLPRDQVVAREIVVARALFADDAGTARLVAMAEAPGPQQWPALAGLGRCRRVKAAETLAAALDRAVSAGDGAQVRGLAESLADIGNAWVWARLPGEHAGEAETVRHMAAEALVRAFARTDGHERQAISNAIMVVDAPGTPALVDAARRRAQGATRIALDKLEARLARNPTR